MIYRFTDEDTADGRLVDLDVVKEAKTIEDAKTAFRYKLLNDALEYGDDPARQARRLQDRTRNYNAVIFLEVTKEEQCKISDFTDSLIKELEKNSILYDINKEREEYERLKSKFGDK